MRLVDCFIDILLFTRTLNRALESESATYTYNAVREKYLLLFSEAAQTATQQGFEKSTFDDAKFAVTAYVDESLLCSNWSEKAPWQKAPLQREFFNTTNIGAGFYDKLNQLSKHGPDRSVREVFSLCLGLGFKGKYFSIDDRQKLEETKSFNLSLLLPEEAMGNLEKTILFPSAYGEQALSGKGSFMPRTNIYPVIFGVPITIFLVTAFIYHQKIGGALDQIISVVK